MYPSRWMRKPVPWLRVTPRRPGAPAAAGVAPRSAWITERLATPADGLRAGRAKTGGRAKPAGPVRNTADHRGDPGVARLDRGAWATPGGRAGSQYRERRIA